MYEIFSSPNWLYLTQIKPIQTLKVDLKIALLIGNGNYEKDRNLIGNCANCNRENKWINNLDIYDSLERLQVAYERLGYIVLAFIDLNAEDFLRAVKLFKRICDKADHVSVLVHVMGHGHNYNHHDYLIPIDAKLKIHNNNHAYHGIMNMISISNLHNLLEVFISDINVDPNKKFYVVCFWDLCRSQWLNSPLLWEISEYFYIVSFQRSNAYEIETNVNIDLQLNHSMEYTVIFGW